MNMNSRIAINVNYPALRALRRAVDLNAALFFSSDDIEAALERTAGRFGVGYDEVFQMISAAGDHFADCQQTARRRR
jgi:hypothetical protein